MSIIHGSAKVNEYLEEHSLAAEAYLPFLNGLIQEARQAREYMVHLSETELEQLSKPGSWKGVPWLEYAEKMRMLFDYKPLHIFREDFQRLLRRVDFITINRKVYRWRNCPAGKEILAAAA